MTLFILMFSSPVDMNVLPCAIAANCLHFHTFLQITALNLKPLAGAYRALFSMSELERMKELSESIKVVELNRLAHFEDSYIEHLMLDV